MNINDKRTETELKLFEDLKSGDVFEFEECFYMKTGKAPYSGTNAVSLADGEQIMFEHDDLMIPVNAEVVIEDEN